MPTRNNSGNVSPEPGIYASEPQARATLANVGENDDNVMSSDSAVVVEHIAADEDLLEDYETSTEAIELVQRRISSIPPLKLERFGHAEKICLRDNQISAIEFPASFGGRVNELDLYDNLISQLKGLDNFVNLKSLDLSFNKLRHIKNINHLKLLTDVYFLQNRIARIEGLDALTKLRNLELAANKIKEIENIEHLGYLEELWLGQNKISELKNLSHLRNLRILSVQSNRIHELSGLSELSSLEELYVSNNAISVIDGLQNNTALRVLDISSNRVDLLGGLEHLSSLEELWASNNLISSFREVGECLADKEQLSTVYFEGNPLQTDNLTQYRDRLQQVLPRIRQIDATYVKK